METTLITGGAGFIGSHAARRLVALGQRVVVLDNFNDFYSPAIKHANVAPLRDDPLAVVIEGDIRDAETVRRAVQDHGVTRVLHLAALGNVRESIHQAPLYVQVNVAGTVNVLEAAQHGGVQIVVLASSSSVYGKTSQVPFVETDAADRPLASYPASKRAAEMLAHAYHNLSGLNVTALRFFNVYGPSGRPDMMPMKVLDALIHGKEITLFDGGTLKRDWTYVEDTVAGVLAALERPLGYEIINLGCGAPTELNAFVEILEELTGQQAVTKIAPAPASEPPITYCDNGKARRLLDFDPQVRLADGLARTWAWYRETFL